MENFRHCCDFCNVSPPPNPIQKSGSEEDEIDCTDETCPLPKTLNLEPETLNLEPETLKPEPETSTCTTSPRPEPETGSAEAAKSFTLPEKTQKDLLSRILVFMENTSEICHPEFTMDIMTDYLHSNNVYVSYVINNNLKKNFRSFLNAYRVREAQRLMSNPENSKYSVEFVANKVGYKSRNSFNAAFKEITGVTAAFYLNALYGHLYTPEPEDQHIVNSG